MLKSICYRSIINNEPSILQTESLFDTCKKNNYSLNIKGLLYRSNSYYFQIIEGKTEDINFIFSKIKSDNRHKDLTILINQPISEFTFNTFATGYNKVEDLDTLFGLQEYHDYIETHNIESKAIFLEIISNLFSVEI
jgi:hypothetical protein